MGAPAPGNGGLHFPRNATAHRAAQTILHLPQWSRAKPQQVAGVRGLYGLVPPLFLSAISYVEDSVAADPTDTTLRRSLRVFMLWYLRATCWYDGVRYLRRQPIAVRTRGRWHRLQPTRSPVMGCTRHCATLFMVDWACFCAQTSLGDTIVPAARTFT